MKEQNEELTFQNQKRGYEIKILIENIEQYKKTVDENEQLNSKLLNMQKLLEKENDEIICVQTLMFQ